jgi:hypothetical protein
METLPREASAFWHTWNKATEVNPIAEHTKRALPPSFLFLRERL